MTETARFSGRRARQALRGSRDTHLDICSDPAFATHSEDPLAEPIKWSFWRSRRRNEEIRVTICRLDERPVVDVRVFFTTAVGTMHPTKKGITLAIDKITDLRKMLEKAEARALELSLIEAVS